MQNNSWAFLEENVSSVLSQSFNGKKKSLQSKNPFLWIRCCEKLKPEEINEMR